MEFLEYYLGPLKKYAVFTGRARRKEFWMFVLCNFIVAIILSIINSIIFRSTPVLSTIYSLAIICPGLGLAIRRMHDLGKSGFWILINLIPIIGIIWYIILAASPGVAGANTYGPDPKA